MSDIYAITKCKLCDNLFRFDVSAGIDGFYVVMCSHCKQQQYILVEFRTIAVPKVISTHIKAGKYIGAV